MDPISSTRPSHFRVLMVVLVVAIAGFVVGLVAFVDFSRIEDPPADPPAGPASISDDDRSEAGADTESSGPQLDDRAAEIDRLSRETEQIRGLQFLRPVNVAFLDDEAFGIRLRQTVEEDLEDADLETVERIWQALGVIDADLSLKTALLDALDAGVLAYYDPETEELVLRGLELNPFTQATLVHELTHALDDQHFDLDRFSDDEVDDDGEKEAAFSFLVEGTASWVEEQWADRLPDADQAARSRLGAEAAAAMDIGGLPEVLLVDISLPYWLGPQFVAELVERAGTDGVDAAYFDPPVSGAQIFDVDAYLTGEVPIEVSPPPADGPVLATEVVGSTGWFSILLATVPAQAQAVAEAWAGDRLVLWQDGPDRWCVRVDVVARSEADAAVVVKALSSFAILHGDAAVSDLPDGLRLEACR